MHLPVSVSDEETNNALRNQISHHAILHGIPHPHGIHGCDLEVVTGLVCLHPFPAKYARILQPPSYLAQAHDPMALLPVVGSH